MKHFVKSTPELVKEIIALHNSGMSINAIGKKVKADNSTIRYWILQKGVSRYDEKFKQLPVFNQDIIRKVKQQKEAQRLESIKLAHEKAKQKELSRKVSLEANAKRDLCWKCKGPKTDPKWKRTHFCSAKCFIQYYPAKEQLGFRGC